MPRRRLIDSTAIRPPAIARLDHVSAPPAEPSIEVDAGRVGEALEDPVRMEGERPEPDVYGKAHGSFCRGKATKPRSLPEDDRKYQGRIAVNMNACSQPALRRRGAEQNHTVRHFNERPSAHVSNTKS